MITRIVRMTFHQKDVDDFLKMFEDRRDKIIAREGCSYLALHRQVSYPNIFFTISHWTDEDALDAYRKSTLFRETWTLTKSWFADRAQAWSLEEVSSIGQ